MWTWRTRWARVRGSLRSPNGGPGTSSSGTRRSTARPWVTPGSRSTMRPSWWLRRSGFFDRFFERGPQPAEVGEDGLAHLARHDGCRPAEEAAWRADRMNGDQRPSGSVCKLVTDAHREGPVDLQLDQPVRLVLGDNIPVGEGPPEEARGAFDLGARDQRPRLGRAARCDAAGPPQVVGGVEHEGRVLGAWPPKHHLRPHVNAHRFAPAAPGRAASTPS